VTASWDDVTALARDRSMGASETADRAARLLRAFPGEELTAAVEALLTAHPSMGPLWRLAHAIRTSEDSVEAVDRFRKYLAGDSTAAFSLSPALPGRVLTISNSSAVAEALAVRKPRTVLCMLSEPGGEGLSMAGIVSAYSEVRVLDDATAIRDVPADAVLIGADAVSPSSVVNKVKSLELVRAAAAADIPRYAVAGNLKLVPFELPTTENFQPVPLGLFTAIALPTGLLKPAQVAERAAAVPMHKDLLALAGRL
jgi:translation initiation factor 2B subunit (eIF-2B alpha/beta/delta family)